MFRATTSSIGVAAALALAACSGGRETAQRGGAFVQVQVAALSSAVESVEVRVYDATAGAFDNAYTLTRTSGSNTYAAYLGGLPTGIELTFHATARDLVNGVTYDGQAVRTLVPGNNLQLVIRLQEQGVPAGYGGVAPVISAISSSALLAGSGDPITLAVSATDPDPADVLSYDWSVSPAGGAFSGQVDTQAGSTVTWTAAGPGVYTVSVTVTATQPNGMCGTATATITVVISDTAAPADIAVHGIINDAPRIAQNGIAFTMRAAPAGSAAPYDAVLTLTFSDDGVPASPAPAIAWSVDETLVGTGLPGAGCLGEFQNAAGVVDPTIANPVFVATHVGVNGVCVLIATVTDGAGASTFGKVSVQVDPTGGVVALPYLATQFQSATDANGNVPVPPGATAVVEAVFMQGGTALLTHYVADPPIDVVPASDHANPERVMVSYGGTCPAVGTVSGTVTAYPVDSLGADITSVSKTFSFVFCAP